VNGLPSGRLALGWVERAADLGQDPLAHRHRHHEGAAPARGCGEY
jgi:hypothetical protein